MRWHRKHGFLGVSYGYTTSEDPGDWRALYEKSCKATYSNFRLVDKPRQHQSANNLPFPASPVGTISQTVVVDSGREGLPRSPFYLGLGRDHRDLAVPDGNAGGTQGC
jgi:hypothetical protein